LKRLLIVLSMESFLTVLIGRVANFEERLENDLG
jgi:hypothetical protein